jgi:putative membrane protein
LAIGLIAGIIFLTRFLEIAMKRFPKPTYMIILGFVLGSVGQVFPGMPTGIEILICLVLGVTGFVLIYFLSKLEEQKTKESVNEPKTPKTSDVSF